MPNCLLRNIGELIYCLLSVKRAAWILLTRGAALSSNLVLAHVRSPIRNWFEVSERTLGRMLIRGWGCCASVTMFELRS